MFFFSHQNFDRDNGQGSCFVPLCEHEELDAIDPEMDTLLWDAIQKNHLKT
jgi:hypothetical protein